MLIPLISCDDENLDDFSDPREQFLGSWDVTESCFKDAYSVEIIKDPENSAQVLIKNFWNMGISSNPPAGLVVGKNIIFDKASFFDSESKVSGEGFIDNDKINWQYEVFDGADAYSCEATYTLQ